MIEGILCAFFGGALVGWALGSTVAKKDIPSTWNAGARAGFAQARCGRMRPPHLEAERSGGVTIDGLPGELWAERTHAAQQRVTAVAYRFEEEDRL